MGGVSNRSVIIVGAGIAGLTLSIFMAKKGWSVVVYEKHVGLADVHGAIYLQSNGIKVASLIGLLPDLLKAGAVITHYEHTSWTASPPHLVNCPLFQEVAKAAGDYPAIGTRRSLLQKMLYERATELGVAFHFGKAADTVSQTDESATVEFAHGTSATGSFLVACDGLQSGIRRALFGEEKAIYTGLTQIASIAPTPEGFGSLRSYREFYAPGQHAMFVNVSHTHSLFACTLREGVETRETWGPMTPKQLKQWQEETPFAKWGGGVGECILGAERVVKYGLYDRPPLSSWHDRRILLIGDAAHPTSPHLGQGGNQAMEDIYHLMRLLPPPPPSDASPLSTSALDTAFTELEKARIGRSAQFVAGARAKGEDRVQADPEKIIIRDKKLRAMWDDPEATLKQWENVSRHPYWHTSEVVF